MKLERIKLADIRPYKNNAKKHPQSQIDQIKNSILEFGNRDPIAVDENNVIIEGHGRFMALQQLGYTEIEVIRITDLTEEQKRAYILIHNQLTLNTGFDLDKLQQEIEQIKTVDLGQFNLEINTDLESEPLETPMEPEAPSLELYKFSLTLSEDQYQELVRATDYLKNSPCTLHNFGNPNKRNNYIFEVIYKWAEQKKLLSK